MNGQELYQRARKRIPGGTQLLSKRPEMFLPGKWPPYYRRAKGIQVEDLEGNCYLDMSLMGVGACVLGYADPDVDAAAAEAIASGSACTLNVPEELELAELLCELHPWADMVRYARAGGEAMSIAVRIARAHTGRDKVAFCGYHGWTDWYLAANLGDGDPLNGHLMAGLEPNGVPGVLRGTAFPFLYNRSDQLKAIVDAHPGEIAAIVMEPQRGNPPQRGFLENVREIASRIGAVLIFDEITTGFRMTTGGIHLLLGVNPDMAVFAKAISNGYPMAAVIGTAGVMQAARKTFISSTSWSERLGPVTALATIRKHRRERVAEHLIMIGEQVTRGWERAAAAAGLDFWTDGLPSLTEFHLMYPEEPTLKTLFTRCLLEQGYLAYHQFKPSLAHTQEHVSGYLERVEEAFRMLRGMLDNGSGSMAETAQSGFQRMT